MARGESVPQVRRWMIIDRVIASGRYPTRAKLAKACEVNIRTIQRDLDALRDVRLAPIEFDQERKGFYYSDPVFRLSAVTVKEEELFALLVAEKVLKEYRGTPVFRHLESVFRKLSPLLSDAVAVPSEWLSDSFSVLSEPSADVNPDIWKIVFNAIRSSKTIVFAYRTPGKANWVPRELEPYHVLCHKGNWYCVGLCRQNGEVKIYALSRMREVSATDTPFVRPAGFDIEAYMNGAFGIFRSDVGVPVVLRFSPSAAPYIEERQWHQGQETDTEADGSLVLRFTASHLFEVKRWVLSWGASVEVLEPASLAEEIRDECRGILGKAPAKAAAD